MALFPTLLFFSSLAPAATWAASPQLKISGNQIVTVSGGCAVRLKGVDVSGLEYSPTGDTGTGRPTTTISGVTMTDYVSIITEAVNVWHCNVVRFPINQDYWFGCSNPNGTPNQTAYRAMIQAVINYCSNNNVYLDLDLHWSGTSSTATAPCGGGWGSSTAQQDMPDMNAVTFWSSVAAAYANNSAVLFDIYNEPHDVSWTIWRNGGSAGSFNTPGLQALLTAVRNAGANNIVVAGGLNWAFDLTGLPANDLTDTGSGNGVLYSSHVYSSKGYPAGGSQWDTYVTDATATTPPHAVIIEEFGATSSDGAAWDNSTISWINGTNNHNYVYSAIAWAFSSDVGPTLLTSFSGYPTTSYHGAPVSTWLYNLNQTPTPNCSIGNTPTVTWTPTRTFTPTFTFTSTFTRTATPTSTATGTPTSTVTSTATRTFSPTNTPTASPTSTPTSTASFTATRTFSPTPTPSNSPTASMTPTFTFSPTATRTPSPTSSPTKTATATSTSTVTSSPTPNATATASSTPTDTADITPTFTSTPTNTTTSTATSTASMTPTATATFTPTATFTRTATSTATASMTSTTTPTKTATWTATPTSTHTPVNTFTATSTSTFTPTHTSTTTPTLTPTASPTPQPTATLSQTASSSTIAPGQALTYTLAVTVSGSQAQNVVVTDNLPSNVTYNNSTGGSVVVNGSQVTWNAGNVPAGSAVTLTINVTVDASATGGSNLSNQALLTYLGGSAQSTTSNVTVVAPTATATASATPSSSPTAAPTPAATVVLFPNPSNGQPVQLNPGLTSVSDVKVEILTAAFRRVNLLFFPQVPAGANVTVSMTDRWGSPLASGLYYVVVHTRQGRTILKLLILR